jgi:ribosomal protein S18 acetylase RimI-like enzyme
METPSDRPSSDRPAEDPVFRPAVKSDAATIAALYRISSDGVADYVWSTLAEPGEDLQEVGRRRYEREGTPFSYENCTIVETEGAVAGMLVAFPMRTDPGRVETDPVLAPYSTLEVDGSYYICGVALFPEFRGRGLGTRLLRLAEIQAQARGLRQLSLIVFEDNAGAKRLYERSGYYELARAPVLAHPLIRRAGDAILMVKNL